MSKLVAPVIERFYECQVCADLIYVLLSKKCVNLKKVYCLRADGMKYIPNNFEYELRFKNVLVLNRRYENVVVEYDYEYESDEIKGNKNMTIAEKIDALEKELAKLKNRLNRNVPMRWDSCEMSEGDCTYGNRPCCKCEVMQTGLITSLKKSKE